MNDPIIKIENLKKRYGRHYAVDGLSLQAPRGAVTALLGANGAGKTTTIQCALNLTNPTSGSIEILGVDSRKLGPSILERVGYVSENQRAPEWMTVDQLLDFLRPLYSQWDKELEKSLRRQFDLPGDRLVRQLSRGMKMKAALLSSLSYRPDLVVLDEPFSGLDPLARDEFLEGLLALTGEEGWSVFISSHDIEEAQRLADHVVIIDAGGAKLNESMDSLSRRFRRVEATLTGESPIEPLPGWLEWETAGRHVRFIEPRFEESAFAGRMERVKHGLKDIRTAPMSLREIFVTLAKTYRLPTGRQPHTDD